MNDKVIQPELKLISKYLSLRENGKVWTFIIPNYQRAYAWQKDKECEKLWDDITQFMREDRQDPYFFGTVIIDASQSDEGMLNIIDGQQRTITFILLMKALLMRIEETLQRMANIDESSNIRRALDRDREDIIQILYKTDVEGQQEIDEDWTKVNSITLIESRSINEQDDYRGDLPKILRARRFHEAESAVYKAKYKRTDNKYSNYFRNFKFFYDKIGEELTDSSSLRQFSKAFLGKCQIIEIKSWQTEEAIQMFNSLNSKGLPLSDSDIISAQLYTNAKHKHEDEEFKKQWEEITSIANRLDKNCGIGLVSIMQQYMHIHTALHREPNDERKADVTSIAMRDYYINRNRQLMDDPLSFCANLKKIALIWDEISEYPIVKLMFRFNMNIRLFLISYLYRYEVNEISRKKVQDIADCLLRLFTILEIVPEGYSSSTFKVFLLTEQIKMVRKEIAKEDVIKDFNNHIASIKWKADELYKLITEEYDKNVLVYLNEYLYATIHSMPFDFSLRSVQVEHIMPLSGHNIEAIRHDAGFSSDSEGISAYKNLVDKIGNKILLEERINKAIGNEWFKSKKGLAGESDTYSQSNFAIAKALSNYPSDLWTKEDIVKATEKVACRIVSYITLTEYEDK